MFKKVTFAADVRSRLIEFLEFKKNKKTTEFQGKKSLLGFTKGTSNLPVFPHNGFVMLDTKLKLNFLRILKPVNNLVSL